MQSEPGVPDASTEVVPIVARELGVKVAPRHREHLPSDDVTSSDEEGEPEPQSEAAGASGSDTETSEDEEEGGDGEEEVRRANHHTIALDRLRSAACVWKLRLRSCVSLASERFQSQQYACVEPRADCRRRTQACRKTSLHSSPFLDAW